MDPYARHPGEVPSSVDWDRVGGLLRTAFTALFGALASVCLAMGILMAMATHVVLSPDQPARAFVMMLSVPEARDSIAADLVADLDESEAEHPEWSGLSEADKETLREALAEVMAAEDFHDKLLDLTIVDGQLDGEAFAAALADQMHAQARLSPEPVDAVLTEMADELRRDAATDSRAIDVRDLAGTLRQLRTYGFVGSVLPVVPTLVFGVLAVVLARRRGLVAALVPSGAVLVAALVLAPGQLVLDNVSGPAGIVAHTFAALGEMAGAGTVWALLLCSLAPPALWWGLREWRRANSTSTSK